MKTKTINSCHLIPRSTFTPDVFVFSDDIIVLNEYNQIGIEYVGDSYLRIEAILTTGERELRHMLDVAAEIAKREHLPKLYFADSLSDELLSWLKKYGFTEKEVLGEYANHYLYYLIGERRSYHG